MPCTRSRCAATVPASIVPAAISVVRRAVATSPLASTDVEREAERVGDEPQRRAEALFAVGPPTVVEGRRVLPEPHQVEQQHR